MRLLKRRQESKITPNVLGTKYLGSITRKEQSTLRKPVENGNSQWLPPQASREDLWQDSRHGIAQKPIVTISCEICIPEK